jgi:hypothetical protein
MALDVFEFDRLTKLGAAGKVSVDEADDPVVLDRLPFGSPPASLFPTNDP